MSTAPKKASVPTHERVSYLDAIVQAQVEEMERDQRVIMMSEDVSVYGSGDLTERFGASRIWPMPISELSFTGVGIGAAIAGLRPIIDFNIASFMYLTSDQIINQASKLRFMTGGMISVPIVFRVTMYYGGAIAAQHSDRPYPMFMNVPGLKIISATTPSDIKGLLKSAIRDDDPVIVFEDSKLWPIKEEVPTDPDFLVPIGKADIKRSGSDVTIVAIAGAMRPTLEAGKQLADEKISIEIIDPRTLKPLDMETIIKSVSKTGRLIIVENAHRMVSASSEIAAIVAEEAFECLKKPIIRLTAPDVHVAFSPVLEEAMYPRSEQIVAAVKRLLS
jgi:pyruvate/2-oxoglutarate/acetoin dehydrogenase E1 component